MITLGALLLLIARPLTSLLWLNYGAMTLHRTVIGDHNAIDITVAEAALERSMAISPSRAAIRNLAFAAYATGDYPGALREAEQLGGEPLMYWLAGQVHYALGDEPKALEAWRNAGASPYLTAQAYQALKQGQLKAAEQFFRLSLRLEPRSASALAGLGETLYVAQRPEEALDPLSSALAIDPDMHRVHYLMGSIYRQRGDNKAAIEHLLLAAKLAPAITPYADMLVDLYRKQGDLTGADYWDAFSTDGLRDRPHRR